MYTSPVRSWVPDWSSGPLDSLHPRPNPLAEEPSSALQCLFAPSSDPTRALCHYGAARLST